MDNNLRETAESRGARYAELLTNGTDAQSVTDALIRETGVNSGDYNNTLLKAVQNNLKQKEGSTSIEMAFKDGLNPQGGFDFYKHDTQKKQWDWNPINDLQAMFSDAQRAMEMNSEHKIAGASKEELDMAKGQKVEGHRRTYTGLSAQIDDPLYALEHPAPQQEQQVGQVLTHVSESLLPHQQRQAADYSHIPLLPLKTPDGITTNYRPIQPGETLRPNEQIYNLQTDKGPVDCIVESQVDAYGRVTYKRQ